MPRKATGNKVGRSRKTKLMEQQRQALSFDLANVRWDHRLLYSPNYAICSSLPASVLAKRMKVVVRTIYKWRNDPLYISEFFEHLAKELAEQIEKLDTRKIAVEKKENALIKHFAEQPWWTVISRNIGKDQR